MTISRGIEASQMKRLEKAIGLDIDLTLKIELYDDNNKARLLALFNKREGVLCSSKLNMICNFIEKISIIQ